MKDKVRPGGGNAVEAVSVGGSTTMGLKQTEQEDSDSFPVKVQGAGVEPFELQVQGFWLVQDALLAVMKRDEVAPRTCLSLALSGATLDPFVELRTMKGLKPGATLRLVEEPYTPRTARAHLAHLQELLRAPGPHDALREGCSPSLLSTLSPTPGTESPAAGHPGKAPKRPGNEPKSEQQSPEGVPPDYVLPGSKERPLLPLLPNGMHSEVPNCLTDLSLSSWNPPPGPRKLQGDFLYITVCTLEGRWCDITSCPRGFFLNRSTLDMYDPRAASSSPPSHCLADLLSQLSSGFKKGFAALRNRSLLPPLENMPTPYRTLSWLGPPSAIRGHRSSFSARLGLEDHAGAQAPDWNEELQAARDLPLGSLEERLLRDRALLQVNSAFVWAAAQGAEAAIDGCVAPIGGGDEDAAFLWGGVFLSRGGSSNGAVPGAERSRRALQRLELKGVQAYSDLGGALQGLHTLPTAVVDYRGFRLSAQGLAPGLESSAGPQGTPKGLLYGVSAGIHEGPQRRKLLELLAQAAKSLSVQRHAVVGPSGNQVPLFTSAHTQGLMGADGRLYLVNLFHVQPVDANFELPGGAADSSQEQEGCAAPYWASWGFPRSFPHQLCQLRPELTQAFIQHKTAQFSQCVRHRMEENGGVEECTQPGDPRGTEAVRAACKDVGSVSDIIFEMRFNPDVFCPGVEFPNSEGSAVRLQKRLLREAAAFLVTEQIPAFVEDCLHFRVCPVDGVTLCQAMHQRGINLRYLGQLARVLDQSEDKERLRHITRLVYGEMVVRSARRILNPYLQAVEVSSLSAAVSHFLCCFLAPHFPSVTAAEEPKKRSKRRGRGGGASAESTAWSALSGTELWSLLNQDAKETYHLSHSLGSSADDLVAQYGLQKLSLLRGLCLRAGIQLRLREYTLDSSSKAPISPDDILNIFPVVKHVTMATSDATQAFHSAQKSIQKGQLYRAYEQLKEAAYLFSRVCDDLHPETCACLSSLARLAYLQGNSTEARSVQFRAVVVSERILGFDHPSTIQEYVLLAVYVFAGRELSLAQRCLYRARLLMLQVHGEDHPYMATLDSSLGLVLQGVLSVQYLQSALRLNTLFRGADDLHTALNHHLLAQRLCCVGDYRGAMAHERDALAIFQAKCGQTHQQTLCSLDFLHAITQQAVRIERSLRQGGAELTDTAPPDSLTPSVETTLEQLTLVNGILKISVSDNILELKEKLMEAMPSTVVNDGKPEPASTINGEGTGKTPYREEESITVGVTGSEKMLNGDPKADIVTPHEENRSANMLPSTQGEDPFGRGLTNNVEAKAQKMEQPDCGGLSKEPCAGDEQSVTAQCGEAASRATDGQPGPENALAEDSGKGEINGAGAMDEVRSADLNGEGERQATAN
ncbi:clustered mitochondria protein homolog isoform X2 [Scleropages formosus]|uniref:clustered mitochondria protein homolog isoform X2 n=1 Tax=Scleropages formosus TaxID=113540 RepID=UPI0010FACC9E|nr:clustered mitochondria protein homolog isoform X2 [Scleropages formosus]